MKTEKQKKTVTASESSIITFQAPTLQNPSHSLKKVYLIKISIYHIVQIIFII